VAGYSSSLNVPDISPPSITTSHDLSEQVTDMLGSVAAFSVSSYFHRYLYHTGKRFLVNLFLCIVS
jgi:hypothetical protein